MISIKYFTATLIAIFVSNYSGYAQVRVLDSFDKSDLFMIAQYKVTDYQFYTDANGKEIPSSNSFFNFYTDINGGLTPENINDLNYLFLKGFSNGDSSGSLYYLQTRKQIPVENIKNNASTKNSVDRFYELSSISKITLGYWLKKNNAVYLIFREANKINSLKKIRIFAALVANNNLYITHAMNMNDEYLYGLKFKSLHWFVHRYVESVSMSLPIQVNQIFKTQKIADSFEQEFLNAATKKMTYQPGDSVAIKYWGMEHFKAKNPKIPIMEYDRIRLYATQTKFLGFKKNRLMLEGLNKGKPAVRKLIKTKKYHGFFNITPLHSIKLITINLVSPYLDGENVQFEIETESGKTFNAD
jgi:hypothetical protein